MDWRKLTTIIVLLSVALLIGYDVLVIAKAGVGASISDVIQTAALQHPVIPFATGFLLGHLFWAQRVVIEKPDAK